MSWRTSSLALLALLGATACGSGGRDLEEAVSAIQTGPPGTFASPFAGHTKPLLERSHAGVRRLDFWAANGEHLAYRESVITDGKGGYAIEPLEGITGVHPDWATFSFLQEQREGYLFRYRDFLIRDEDLFQANWKQTSLASTAIVAGQPCSTYRIERKDGTQSYFEVRIDDVAGLVLAYDEFDSNGTRLASMIYESFNPTPNLADKVMHEARNEERRTDLLTLAEEYGGFLLTPTLPPPGYNLQGVSVVSEGNGHEWVKLTYLDGVETLFFLLKLPEPGRNEFQVQLNTQGVPEAGVRVLSLGASTVLEAHLANRDMIVVGKSEESLLLDFLESALP